MNKILTTAFVVMLSTPALAEGSDSGTIFASKAGEFCKSFQLDNQSGPKYAVLDSDVWAAVQASQTAKDTAFFFVNDFKIKCGFGTGEHKTGPIVEIPLITGFYHR